MNSLQSYGDNLNIALIGASGGIGHAVLQQLLENANVARVYSFARQPLAAAPGHYPGHLDIADEGSIERAATSLKGVSLHLILVTTGLLHSETLRPEKSLRQLEADNLQQLISINSLGPMLVAKHFLPLVPRKQRSAFVAISARVGSISDNRLGGWYSYRASKAALNMLLQCLSIESRLRYPKLVVAGLHPGTVNTGLSEPFQRSVKPEQLFTPAQSARYLLKVLDGLSEADSGGVFAWDGERIPA
ncbi:MAG: SDR family NAD(P)-dependent oxidoreductase [Marinobacterium sp.]|nr:SDR family NAD(P)-dependent oxidoreductase [Marinobacterium sp.]